MDNRMIEGASKTIIVLLIMMSSHAFSQSMTTISGEVLGSDDEKMSSIWVRAYSGETLSVDDITDENGAFSFQVAANSGPVTLRFDTLSDDGDQAYLPEVLDNISTTKDSTIIKGMPNKSGVAFNAFQLVQILSNYDKAYKLDIDYLGMVERNNTITREAVINRNIFMLDMLKHVDKNTENQLARIRELYNKFRPGEVEN